ncbi:MULTISPECIES: class I SAM-dependent methyltransferase [unclassified Methanosarcina]|uniref:class I SAM-dependent methyltransferase n=1 Tax=unclassified Methanosarcina TaxID=2644672 RepID=UPI000615666E|nr:MULTISPECIES: class I SAM-dependent methyltransferase [unclassified Methanosarcina]AKB19298.1 Methylated-DNA--protein-cysteine methyltransferase [Methanosarcina sp. WWM596]AKB22874.1 Methylated-DNA--protein-cysteine methyltransferase [Methanosarcina sp. WH1]
MQVERGVNRKEVYEMKKEATGSEKVDNVMEKEILNRQQPHWEKVFSNTCSRFGDEASYPARKTAAILEKEGKTKILELGGGQGRDTCFFASRGFSVHSLDYTESGPKMIKEKAEEAGLGKYVTALRHDVRNSLPFEAGTFDACYSHMLYCMALTTDELEFLCSEIKRVLKPGGINIYTARHTGDAHYGTGKHRGEDMYEITGGFIVHFFSREKVKHLAKGYESFELETFEEGGLPRKLYMVTMQK